MDQNQVSKSFLWSFLEQASVIIIQFVVQIVLARLLAPEIFGVLAIILVVVNILNVLAQSGLGSALIQDNDADEQAFSTAVWLSLGFAALLYLLVYFLSGPIALFYGMVDLDLYIRVLSLCIFFNAFNSIQRSYLQKTMNFRSLFLMNLFALIASGIVGIVMAYSGAGIWALIAQTIVQSAIACLVMAILTPLKISFTFSIHKAKSLFSYGWKMCMTGVLATAYNSVSELIIGKTCTSGDLGLYSQGRKWPIAAIGAITNAVANVLFPALARLKEDRAAFQNAIIRALQSGTYIIAPLCFLLAVIAEPLIVILLTDKWISCVPVFQVTCVSYCVLMLQLVNLRAYMALGDSGLYMKLHIIKLSIGVILLAAVALTFHDIYVIAFVNGAYTVFSIICIDAKPAKRKIGVGILEQLRLTLPTFLTAGVSALVAYPVGLLSFSYGLELVLQVVLFAIAYVAISKILKIGALSDIIHIMQGLFHRK